jgi:lysozyme family protein
MTSPFESWLAFLSEWEGGRVDDPADHGGATAFGISTNANPDVDLDALTPERVARLARERYWVPCGGDVLPPRLAIACADYGFHSGPATAVRDLQRCVGALPDGAIGPRTLEAVRVVDRDLALALALNERRRARLRAIAERPGQGRFLRGWLNRVDALDELIGEPT